MFKHISIDDCNTMMQNQEITIVDVRDSAAFSHGRIPGAISLSNDNIEQFIEQTAKDKPLLVCCYHGNSSQGAADYLNEKGFSDTYSIDGGFEAWKLKFEIEQ